MAWIGSPKRESNTFVLKTRDTLGNNNTNRINFALQISDVNENSDTAIALDSFARAVTALTTNSYSDAEINTARNLESIVGGE